MRWNVTRPSLTAATMPASPGSVNTMPAADLATSVAVETAMPICAWRSAGASLAPSPHIPTLWPPFWNDLTSLYLSSGRTPAKTANCSGWTASGIGPGGQMAPSSPTAFATMAAVAGASPVTITARTPKPCNSLINAAESFRGGALGAASPAGFIPVAGPVGPARPRQHAEALVLEFLGRGGRGRRRLGKADDNGVGALHDSLRVSRRIRRGCLGHLLGRIEGGGVY